MAVKQNHAAITEEMIASSPDHRHFSMVRTSKRDAMSGNRNLSGMFQKNITSPTNTMTISRIIGRIIDLTYPFARLSPLG
jgi:hypothetical protein